MIATSIVRRLLLGAATSVALATAGISLPVVVGTTAAYAQAMPEFQEALDQYGEWRRDPRYGDVWAPTGLPRDWRPYENGHWVYTDDWGWYWVSDPEEEDFGWVTYHYGRWVHDRASWFWVPGDEWAPAWVDWRYGDDTIGWAPLPPDGYDVAAYEADPVYWVFVPDRYMTAPRLRTYFVPQNRRASFLRSTRIVNRTMATRGVHIAVNPGISPAFVARVTRKALPTYQVRPRVFASTQGVSGAVQVKREELHRPPGASGGAPHFKAVSVQRTTTVIKVDAAVTAPKPLGKGESGVLGSHPPRAAQGGATPQSPSPALQPPAGAPSHEPPHTGPVPAVHPNLPAKPEERRDVHPPGTNTPAAPSGQPSRVEPVHPVETHTPPPAGPKPPLNAQPAQQPHPAPPPPVVHAPPPPSPPVVHAPPPPVVNAPPPPAAVHAPPPPAAKPAGPPPKPAAPPPKPGEKPPEPPK